MDENKSNSHQRCHHLGGHIPNNDSSVSNIRTAFFLNAGFVVIEFIGAYFSNSTAIASDAIHDLGDSLALGLAWGLAYASNSKKTSNFTYGYQRLSLLGALLNTLVLSIGLLVVVYHALPRLWNPKTIHSPSMLGLALLGIIVNGYAVYKTSESKGLNEKTVSLHLLEDVLGWIAVAITSVVVMFTDLFILDPILSLLISAYVFQGVIKNFRVTLLLFLQATPSEIITSEIEEVLTNHKWVKGVHDTHIWSLDGSKHILSAHIVISKKCFPQNIPAIKIDLRKKLKEKGISHATLEIEFEDEVCQMVDSC